MLDSARRNRTDFAYFCQSHTDAYSGLLLNLVLLIKYFRLHGHVKTQNVRIWETETSSM